MTIRKILKVPDFQSPNLFPSLFLNWCIKSLATEKRYWNFPLQSSSKVANSLLYHIINDRVPFTFRFQSHLHQHDCHEKLNRTEEMLEQNHIIFDSTTIGFFFFWATLLFFSSIRVKAQETKELSHAAECVLIDGKDAYNDLGDGIRRKVLSDRKTLLFVSSQWFRAPRKTNNLESIFYEVSLKLISLLCCLVEAEMDGKWVLSVS